METENKTKENNSALFSLSIEDQRRALSAIKAEIISFKENKKQLEAELLELQNKMQIVQDELNSSIRDSQTIAKNKEIITELERQEQQQYSMKQMNSPSNKLIEKNDKKFVQELFMGKQRRAATPRQRCAVVSQFFFNISLFYFM
jgi:hypothetical protein